MLTPEDERRIKTLEENVRELTLTLEESVRALTQRLLILENQVRKLLKRAGLNGSCSYVYEAPLTPEESEPWKYNR